MKMHLRWLWIVVLACAVVTAGCGGMEDEGGAERVTLNGAGASFPYPLYTRWIDEYASIKSNVRINYQSIGSGGGIEQLKARTVDFGASDAALSDEDLAEMPGEVVHIPTVAGAVVVPYNLDLDSPLRLRPELLAGIFLGEIKAWNDPKIAAVNSDVSLPATAIAVAHRSDGSGTTNIFTSYLSAISDKWADAVGAGKSVDWPTGIGAKGNEGVTAVIQQTPGAIGYVELAYALQNDIPYATLRNAAGNFVEPSLESTTAAAAGAVQTMVEQNDVRISIVNSPDPEAYPIAGFTYILVYTEQEDKGKGEALVTFLDWAIHEGQEFAGDLHYARLPDALVEINEGTLRMVAFEGQPVLAD